MTNTYRLINHMDKGPQVHAEGCRDIARQARSNFGDDGWTFEVAAGADLAYEACRDMYAEMAYEQIDPNPENFWQLYKSEFKIHNCATHLNTRQVEVD